MTIQPFDLKSNTEIVRVYKFVKGTFESYIVGKPDFAIAFSDLECGNPYWIVLKPNESEGTVDIPDFVSNEVSSNEEQFNPLIKYCGDDTVEQSIQLQPQKMLNHLNQSKN